MRIAQTRATKWRSALIALIVGFPLLSFSAYPVSTQAAGGSSAARITTSTDYACGITSRGDLYCWGRNDLGQLGDGTNISKSLPTLIPAPNGGRWSGNIEGADEHTCGITTDARLYCWGEGRNGKLGNGTVEDKYVPTLVAPPDGSGWAQVDLSDLSTCALTTRGNLYCWGYLYWILNQGEDLSEPHWYLTPQQVNLNGIKIDSFVYGNPNICALAKNKLYCWGAWLNPDGLHPGNFEPVVEEPTPWGPAGFKWDVISSQGPMWCGIDQINDLYCWGYIEYMEAKGSESCDPGFEREGWCFRNRWVDANNPEQITVPGIKWRDLSVRSNACAISTMDDLYCWGFNYFGEVGVGILSAYVSMPTEVAGPASGRWAYAEVGDLRACGVATSGEFYCWGMDHEALWDERGCTPDPSDISEWSDWCASTTWGALGNGATIVQSSVPVRADPPQSTVDPDTLVPAAPGVAPLSVAPNRSAAPSLTSSSAARYRAITYKVPTTKFIAILKPTTPTYQWYRCPTAAPEASGSIDSLGCTLIIKATKTSYKSVAADRGSYLRVLISATNGRGAGAVTTQVFTPSTARLP